MTDDASFGLLSGFGRSCEQLMPHERETVYINRPGDFAQLVMRFARFPDQALRLKELTIAECKDRRKESLPAPVSASDIKILVKEGARRGLKPRPTAESLSPYLESPYLVRSCMVDLLLSQFPALEKLVVSCE